ncbi:MAG: MBL fold metallo-hydrolase [Desulfobulbaceae bacterium]|nr:MBL fold metallo-hydrolase [Desulfobulbaceae bacterium]
MKPLIRSLPVVLGIFLTTLCFADTFERDTIPTSAGNLEITFIGHGTLMMRFAGKIIHIDPYSSLADYGQLPKADIILLTHHHGDHLDPDALGLVRTATTDVILTEKCAEQVSGGKVMKNGDTMVVQEIMVEAVPAYNLVHKRDNGEPFHPRGEGNGYIVTFGATRVYIAGDTENTPEMKKLTEIDIAFLPMNLPYTMTPEMAADAALAFRPKILYPYHFGETDSGRLVELMQGREDVEIRLRNMK